MPIITFWSNNEKAIGQTVSAVLASTVMAIEQNYKILLISADINNNRMEGCFGALESNKEIVKSLVKNTQVNLDSGVKGLMKLADSNRISPELIHDYTKIIFKNRLEVLYSPTNISEENEKIKIMGHMKNIILNASRYYDQVIIDLKKGFEYPEQLEILSLSDVIVANVDQNIQTIEKFLSQKETNSMQNKFIWNICRYDKNSKYNNKNLSRTILKGQNICSTWYNTLVLDATQEGGVAELLLRLKTLKTEDDNKVFIEEIKQLNEKILLKYQETRMKM